MDALPVELLHAIAVYCGWEGYEALRSTCKRLRACLPWAEVYRTGRGRTVPLDTLRWDTAWFARALTPHLYVQGTHILDGFHGVIFLLDLDKSTVLGEGVCARGHLEGALIIHHPWRGGTSLVQVWHKGVPVPLQRAATNGREGMPATTPAAPGASDPYTASSTRPSNTQA